MSRIHVNIGLSFIILFSISLIHLFSQTASSHSPTASEHARQHFIHHFKRVRLDKLFYSEGASFGDFNKDGHKDIVSGPFWYAGPDFKKRHTYYNQKPFNPKGYSNNFFAFVEDISGDGYDDIMIYGFPGKDASWFQNPGKSAKPNQPWKRHLVLKVVDNESPTYIDINNDNLPDIVSQSNGFFGYATRDPKNPEKPWTFHKISKPNTGGRFTHGLGVGDVNGDGRLDILWKKGWFEQPKSLKGDPVWKHHSIPFAPSQGGAQMYAYDFDGDGDNDVLTSLQAHGHGLALYEQVKLNGKITFNKHIIIGNKPADSRYGLHFTQMHAIDLVDMDGDGIKDIITGKRWWAHGGNDPGGKNQPVTYWLKTVRNGKPKTAEDETGLDFVPHFIDDDTGVGTQVVAGDVNNDNLPDIIVGNKKGTTVLIHVKQRVSAKAWHDAQPKVRFPAKQPAKPVAKSKGVLPLGDDGQPLNLNFETGTLKDWTATGTAFARQPVKGDTVAARRNDMKSNHAGKYWIGGYEINGDKPTGTLTSKPFKVTHPYARFLANGGPDIKLRVEIVLADSQKVIHTARGKESENLIPHTVDLRPHLNKKIFIRIVDEHTGGWGHINFDDFTFHKSRPSSKPTVTKAESLPDVAGLQPEEAAKAMTAPPGFRVTLAAGEPLVHQPVAFTIDHRGRLWVAEAYTYPRRAPGKRTVGDGKDRIIILEDKDKDGRFESRKTFIEGLNLVSGLEVGFGGVWVGAAPYLMFIPDKNLDDKPDGPPTVLLDGFGYQDTHETLNAFIWGPDGWLYGCHGVFTHSKVGKPGTPDNQRIPMNCAVWRYHPTKHKFEIFAHGTSNPWGVDFNDHGQAFITACVIPHLYHVIQGARYQRQGGQHFNPHTYDDIKTIADHLHYAGNIRDHAWWGRNAPVGHSSTDAAGGGHAHAGAMIYLADNWPQRFRNRLFMANIHGNRINQEVLVRKGSGYVGSHAHDMVFANDRWFRGINLKYGPDGSVFIIDWYDKNACHRGNPEVWDRTNGRIYKVTYKYPKPVTVNLENKSSRELAELHLHPNDWYVRTARRILQHRAAQNKNITPAISILSDILANHKSTPRRLRALWTLHAVGHTQRRNESLLTSLLADKNEYLRAWAIQLLAEDGKLPSEALSRLAQSDPSPVVRLYIASALQRIPHAQRWPILTKLLTYAQDTKDHNLPLMLWYAAEPLVPTDISRAMSLASTSKIPLIRQYILRRAASDKNLIGSIIAALGKTANTNTQILMLDQVISALQGRANVKMPREWPPVSDALLASKSSVVKKKAEFLAVRFGDKRIFPLMRQTLANSKAPIADRSRALKILASGKDKRSIPVYQAVLNNPALVSPALRALAQYDDPKTPVAILDRYPTFTPAQRADAIATLASRPAWAHALLDAMGKKMVPQQDLPAFTVRQILKFNDDQITAKLKKVWGAVRSTSADKKKQLEKYKKLLTPQTLAKANLPNGRVLFNRTCAICHKLFGEGKHIGPDITGSNRANLDYILENILDPSATIGRDYQLTIFTLNGNSVVAGMVAAESDSAYTVRTLTDTVVVAKSDIKNKSVLPQSMMPENLLLALKANEVIDLIAYLATPTQIPLPGEIPVYNPATKSITGALEAEKLKVLSKTGGKADPQGMASFTKGKWSALAQLWWIDAKPGQKLNLQLPVKKTGKYKVFIAMTKARDYGIVQHYINNKKIGPPIDLYAYPNVLHSGPVLLGTIDLPAGNHTFTVEIVGSNKKAIKRHMYGLDYIYLTDTSLLTQPASTTTPTPSKKNPKKPTSKKPTQPNLKPASKPITLFDGKSFKGWEGPKQFFRIENGAIVGGNLKKRIPKNQFLATLKSYNNFELKLKVKLIGKGCNSGIQFRSVRIPNHHEMIGYQADAGKGWWGKLYDESRRNRVLAGPDPKKLAAVLKPNDWNNYIIRCEGNRVRLYLNGLLTVDFTEPDPKIKPTGKIAVQIHSGPPSEAHFKDISITPLK